MWFLPDFVNTHVVPPGPPDQHPGNARTKTVLVVIEQSFLVLAGLRFISVRIMFWRLATRRCQLVCNSCYFPRSHVLRLHQLLNYSALLMIIATLLYKCHMATHVETTMFTYRLSSELQELQKIRLDVDVLLCRGRRQLYCRRPYTCVVYKIAANCGWDSVTMFMFAPV